MGILKRFLYMEIDKDGKHRFSDWAKVTTSLGTMVEPGRNFLRAHSTGTPFTDVDYGDEISRIDGIRIIDLDNEKVVLSNGDIPLNGGNCIPRDGR